MTTFDEWAKIICEETNIHEVTFTVAKAKGKDIELCFWTNLGFSEKPDEVYLKVGGEKVTRKDLVEQVSTLFMENIPKVKYA